jgi:hypothetical protein
MIQEPVIPASFHGNLALGLGLTNNDSQIPVAAIDLYVTYYLLIKKVLTRSACAFKQR